MGAPDYTDETGNAPPPKYDDETGNAPPQV